MGDNDMNEEEFEPIAPLPQRNVDGNRTLNISPNTPLRQVDIIDLTNAFINWAKGE